MHASTLLWGHGLSRSLLSVDGGAYTHVTSFVEGYDERSGEEAEDVSVEGHNAAAAGVIVAGASTYFVASTAAYASELLEMVAASSYCS